MKPIITRLQNASIATKLTGFAASLLLIVVLGSITGLMMMQNKATVYEAKLFADGMEKVALSGLTTLMMTGQMEHRELLLEQINETGIVSDLRIIRGDKVKSIYGEGRSHEQVMQPIEKHVLETGEPYFHEDQNNTLRIINPILAKSNYLGKNCLGCHQVGENEILGAITMKISLAQVTEKTKQFSFNIFAVGMFIVLLLIGGLLVLSRFIIKNPLEKLLTVFHKLQQKDYTQAIQLRYRDEIGKLGEGVSSFLEHSIELLTKLSKVSSQLSLLAEKNRTSSEKFVQLAYGQSASLSETSAAVQELNASLRFEQDKLSAFNTQIAQLQHYAQEMDDGYQELTIAGRNTQTELQNSDKGLRKGYKYLHNTILELEELLEKNIFSDETEEKTKIWNTHNILTTLNKAKTLLHDGILNFIEAQKKTEKFNQILQSAVEKSKKQDTERTKIIDIYQSILKQLDTQTDASDGISTALNGLASKSSDYSDSAADLAQVANEASKLAVLLKDLLHEFKLP